MEALLCLVTDLGEKVSSLKSIRHSEVETDYSCSLPSMGQAQQAEGTHCMEDSLSSPHVATHSDLMDKGQWQQVPAWRISSVNTPPSQVPVCNRYEALQVESNDIEEYGSTSLEVSLRLSQLMPCIKTVCTKTKGCVIVRGDSLLKGTKDPVCRPDPLHREACCFPGAWVRDAKRKIPSLVKPSN